MLHIAQVCTNKPPIKTKPLLEGDEMQLGLNNNLKVSKIGGGSRHLKSVNMPIPVTDLYDYINKQS